MCICVCVPVCTYACMCVCVNCHEAIHVVASNTTANNPENVHMCVCIYVCMYLCMYASCHEAIHVVASNTATEDSGNVHMCVCIYVHAQNSMVGRTNMFLVWMCECVCLYVRVEYGPVRVLFVDQLVCMCKFHICTWKYTQHTQSHTTFANAVLTTQQTELLSRCVVFFRSACLKHFGELKIFLAWNHL
jgi:hypothetical protein